MRGSAVFNFLNGRDSERGNGILPKYRYTAADSSGRTVRGIMSAVNEQELHRKLKSADRYLLRAEEIRTEGFGRAWKPKELSELCRELSLTLSAGIPLAQALKLISQTEGLGRKERKCCLQVLSQIQQGASFSDALERQGAAFPALMIFTFRAAEAAGQLDVTVGQMADYYLKEHQLSEKLAGASAYPRLLAVLIAAVLAVLTKYVLPQFEPLFSMMEELPLPTRLLYGGLELCELHLAEMVSALLFLFLIWRWLRTISVVRLFLDRLLVCMPFAGNLWRAVCTARFARALSFLYRAGVPLAAGMQLAARTIGNVYVSRQVDTAVSRVRAGERMGEVLASVDGFTGKLAAAVRVGEESKSLDVMLDSMAAAMEYDAETAIARKMTYLEPVMIIAMAVIVGFVMIAVMLPIYESYNAIEMLAYS